MRSMDGEVVGEVPVLAACAESQKSHKINWDI